MMPGNHCTMYRKVPIPTKPVPWVLTDEEENGFGRKLFLREEFFYHLGEVITER